MSDITVIILTYNEEIHIRRCIENVKGITDKVFVVDCFSTDKTVEIATGLGAEVVMHEWPGNQAAQFNWALDNIPINTEWVLRLDADEYLSDKLINELQDLESYDFEHQQPSNVHPITCKTKFKNLWLAIKGLFNQK